jgi:hypothetical protein
MVEIGGHQRQNGREHGELIINDSESAPAGFCGRNHDNWQLDVASRRNSLEGESGDNARRIVLTLDPPLRSVHSISQVILPVLIRGPRLCVFGAITIHT